MGEEKIITLYWWIDDNYISDEYGNTIFDIYELVTPNQLFFFKTKCNAVFFIPSNNGKEAIELIAIG